ncbi:metallophosphoesterase family protein [Bacillus sp. B15-48]|uniref:metallophosphoesterase family protein n=1 Tax=Bacillus sp. B15-48 TaxID=1548601 RepID=UPI00193FC2D6|nr:metallophosphoesterase family protein [Bacillus sp. B15-48]MBM4763879.1 metallophosphoesterase [Bacillus sp. B15-48]
MGDKIAILTDIHGNCTALTAVLEEIDQNDEVQHIYCLGDLIGIGHETNEVLDVLFSRRDLSIVLGNHEEAILAILNGKEPKSKGNERAHHEWIASHISEDFISYIKEFPKSIMAKQHDVNLLFTHYHLDEKEQFLQVDYEPTVKKLDEIYQKSNADIVCFGHHHVVHHFKSKERMYFNPGSLGCNHKPLAPYAILSIGEGGSIDLSLKEVPYDNQEFLLTFDKLNVPAKEFILNLFYGNQHLKYL